MSGVLRAVCVAAMLACVAGVRAQGDAASANQAGVAGDTVVRMYPAAVVTAETVRLVDVAEVTGEAAQVVAQWPVTGSPRAGGESTLELSTLQQVLIHRGINPTTWVFRGSTRCKIERPTELTPNPSSIGRNQRYAASGDWARLRIERDRGEFARAVPTTRPATGDASSQYAAPACDPNTLEGAIHQYVAERLSRFGGRPAIQFNPAAARLLQLSRPMYEFAIAQGNDAHRANDTHRDSDLVGLVPLEVTVYERGQPIEKQTVLADVRLCRKVVLATGMINRGEIIKAEQLALRERQFSKLDELGLSEINAVAGQRCKRFVKPDELISRQDIEPVPIVQRNDLVTVSVRRGAIEIKAVGKALGDASYGQAVQLRSEMSKETFTAIVTGPRMAELVANTAVTAQVASAAGGDR